MGVIYTFCIKHGKMEVVEKFNDLVQEFEKKLTSEEQSELRADIEHMLREKAEEIAEELSSTYDSQEVDQILSEFKAATAP